MGNCGCLSSAAASSLTEDQLKETFEKDQDCLGLFQRLLPNSEIVMVAAGLDTYQLRSLATEAKSAADPEDLELALLCLQNDPQKGEKQRSEVVRALSNKIQFLRESEKSPEAKFGKAQIQILCRVYDALLREEEREKRRVIEKSKEGAKSKKKQSEISPVARMGLDFGINVLLSLVEVVGYQNPLIVKRVLEIASRVVSKLEPFSLVEYEGAVTESVEAVTKLFGSVLSGQIPGLDRSDELKTMTAMMGLALASGGLGACLSLAQKFLSFPADPAWSYVLKASIPMMNKLYSLSPTSNKDTTAWTWNTEKVGPDIIITNDNKTITRTNSNAWGNNLSEQTMASGAHYVALNIDQNSSSCLLIGVASINFSEWGSKSSVNNVICWQADGDVYVNSSGVGNIGSYTAGDKIGMFIDMDEHKLTFYKNDAQIGKDWYEGVPSEAAVIICFGGSSQFVSFIENPDIPEGIDPSKIARKKKGEEGECDSQVFPKTSSEILSNPAFNPFTKLETTGTESAMLTATFLLASLDSQGDTVFGKFELDEIKASYCTKITFQRTVGLSLDVQETTFGFLFEILAFLMDTFSKHNWEEIDFRLAVWSSLSCLRILRNHIFAAKLLELPESETGLTSEKLLSMRSTLEYFSKVSLQNLSLEDTPENTIAVETLSKTAAMTIIHSFELYYPTLNSQLDFLLDGFSRAGNEEGENRLMTEIMKRIRLPTNLIRAFDTSSEENRTRVQRFLQALLTITTQQSLSYLEGSKSIDEGLITTFFMALNVLMARIVKIGMSEEGLGIFRPFAFQFLDAIEKLVEKAISVSGGEVSTALESRIKSTILGQQTIVFLKAMNLLQFDSEFNFRLMIKMLQISKLLGQLHGGKREHAKGLSFEHANFESDHPYVDNMNTSYEFQVPNAVGYVLTFDSRCKSENNCDYLELWTEPEKTNRLHRWEGTTWPSQPVEIAHKALFFTFHSDGSNTEWGWKIDVAAKLTIDILIETWADDLKTCVSSLLVSLSRSLIVFSGASGDASTCAVLASPLIKSGVTDEGVARLLQSTQEENQSLAELIELTNTVIPNIIAGISTRFSDIPILDELILGSDRTVAAFADLKKQAKVSEPAASIGGDQLDQAERALFAVFLAFFDISNSFAALADSPKQVCEMLLHIVKMTTQIRQWASNLRKKSQTPNSEKRSYGDIGKEIVDKCVVLLNTDYQFTMTDLGIDEVLNSLLVTVQQTVAEETVEVPTGFLQHTGSKWAVIQTTMNTIKQVKKLRQLKQIQTSEKIEERQSEDKRQFQGVYTFVMQFLESQVAVTTLMEEIRNRRSKAISRIVGLNIFNTILSSKGQSLGLIASAFVESFSGAGVKKHYTYGVEGVDPRLLSVLRSSFFSIYKHFFACLTPASVQNGDCTSSSSFQNYMRLMDALNFPLDIQDISQLPLHHLKEFGQLLLTWAKGLNIEERFPSKFDVSKVIVDLQVFEEAEYDAKEGIEAFSLHPKNRLAGEEVETVKGQAKRVVELKKGSIDSELLPISDVILAAPNSENKGYARIIGNVNELGDELCLLVKREDPTEGGKYLKTMKVTGWNPVAFEFSYEPYNTFLIVDSNDEDKVCRKNRRDILRHTSWLLLKVFTNIHAGQNEDQRSVFRQTNRRNLQELFLELLFSQLKWAPSNDTESLSLKKILSGNNWREGAPISELKKNPIVEWIEFIREDSEEHVVKEKVVDESKTAILEIATKYLSEFDPMLKGVLQSGEVSQSVPEEYYNSRREVDFFCFLRHVVKNADSMLSPFWRDHVRTSPVYDNLPRDYYEALHYGREISVSAILDVLSIMFRNSEPQIFISYLTLFLSADNPGVVPSIQVPPDTPPEFLNEDNELDFFTTLKAICKNEENFPTCFQEIKPIRDIVSDLPISCSSFYKNRLSNVYTEYQASLLLLLYECCNSQTMLSSLSKPTFLLELLKHMLMGALHIAIISFRVVAEILLSQHSPESFSSVWASLPKGKLRAELGLEASSDFIRVLFALIGIRALTHTRSMKYAYLSPGRLERIGFESLKFLLKISKSERWRNRIMTSGMELIEKTVSIQFSGNELLFGFLSYLQIFRDNTDQSTWEWSHAKLKGLSLPEGTFLQYSDNTETAEIYFEESNKLLNEKKSCVLHSLFELPLPLFNSLPSATAIALFDSLLKLFKITAELPSSDTSEEKFVISAVQQTANNYIIRILSSIIESKHSIPSESFAGLISLLIQEMDSDGDFVPDQLRNALKTLLFTKHKALVSGSIAEIIEEIKGTSEEESTEIEVRNSEKRCLIGMLKSIGFPQSVIREALELGLTNVEDVLRTLSSRAKESVKAKHQSEDAIPLYKLTKSDVNKPSFIGNLVNATYRETISGRLLLGLTTQTSEPISLLKRFENSTFERLEFPLEEITIIVFVDLFLKEGPCECELVIGDLSVPVSKDSSTHCFRVFISYNGRSQVFLEPNSQLISESQSKFSFAKISTMKFGIKLSSPGKIVLKDFAIFEGHYTNQYNSSSEDIPEETFEGHLVNFELKSVSSTETVLASIIGVSPAVAAEIAVSKPVLKHALASVTSSKLDLTDFETDYGQSVQNFVIVKRGSKVPEGYNLVKIVACGQEVGDCSEYNGPILAVQMNKGKKKEFITCLNWKEETIVAEKNTKPQDLAIVSILIIRAADPTLLVLPQKFTLLKNGEKAVNIANKGEVCHFLAYCYAPSIRKWAFDDLLSMSKESSEDGMVDKFSEEDNVSELNSSELSKEIAKHSSLSSVQLQYFYSEIEKKSSSEASFRLIIKLLRQQSEVCINSEQFAKLLEHSGQHYEELNSTIFSLLTTPRLSPSIANTLLLEVLTQLCQACVQSLLEQSHKRSATYESTHPYENNLDIKDKISFPGAIKLAFTFAPECKSENNYDFLEFASDPEFTGVTAKQTGTSWPNFEVEGDTIYMHFKSDGSNNDWGYKFVVEAVIVGTNSRVFGVKRALWCLEYIFSEPKLASLIPLFVGKETINALIFYIHRTNESSLCLRSISLLKKILLASSDISASSKAVIALIGQETAAMFREETVKSKKSVFLRSLISFLTEVKEKYEFETEEEWFNTFYENYCFLKGFVNKDDYFQYLLLSQFLTAKNKKPELVLESQHPYPSAFATKELYICGASRINVRLSPESDARLVDGILFSKDPAGLQPILSTEMASSESSESNEVLWNNIEKGPDIAISNGGRTVTRTNSNGWGSTVTNRVFREGRISVAFKIENDGDSQYLYLGVMQDVTPYALSDCTYKDWGKRIWTYKITGEVHKQGFSTEVQKFATGDMITVTLDFNSQTVTFLKNSKQIYQFNDLNVPVTFICCFGGSNQIVSIAVTETMNKDPMKLSQYKTTVFGDRFFYHFPVHIGYFDFLFAAWKPVTHPLFSFYNNNRCFVREQGDIIPLTVFSNEVIRAVRNLFEIKVVVLGPGTILTFGIGVMGQNDIPVAYSTNGAFKKPGGNAVLDTFKAGDSIAFQLFLSKGEFTIYKNGVKYGSTIRVVLGSTKEYRWFVSLNGQARVEIGELSPLVETADLLGRSVPTGCGAFTKYGYQLTATPVFVGTNKRFIFDTLGELQEEWQRYYDSQKNLFSDDVCQQLVEFMDEKAQTADYDPRSHDKKDVNPEPEELVPYSTLKKLKVEEIQTIFGMIKDVNRRAIEMMPLISLDLPEGSQTLSEIQDTFLRLRTFLFLHEKRTILRDFLSKTNTEENPTIEINRTQAIRQREKGLVDTFGASSIFGQIYQQTKQRSNRSLRHDTSLFQVKLIGDEAEQAGGSYIEILNSMCEELQSSYVPMLALCYNGLHSLGSNRETWVPNPAADSPIHYELYEFIGKLIGVAIRTKTSLGLRLSPVFWKKLVFEPVELADVKLFDECAYQTIEILHHLDEKGITNDNFSLAFGDQTFTTVDSGLRSVELLPGGKSIPVEFATAQEYANLLEKQRLSESQAVYAAIRKGISAVIPLHHLYLFTGKQVDTLVCGIPDFSVDLFRKKAVYSEYTDTSEIIQQFWETLGEFNPRERSLFLQFVWGRSRLPIGSDSLPLRICKKEVEGDPNEHLPVAHVSSFTLDLPAYTSKKSLKEKLVYSIMNCKAVDLEKVTEVLPEEKLPVPE